MTTPQTEREKEVPERVSTGASNREVAEELGLSERTANNRLKNILQKLHLGNRVQLTRCAFGLCIHSADASIVCKKSSFTVATLQQIAYNIDYCFIFAVKR